MREKLRNNLGVIGSQRFILSTLDLNPSPNQQKNHLEILILTKKINREDQVTF